jgi:hypothetical protein
MSDPRNFVASSPFSCEREGGRYHLHGAWADWPGVVAFARAILAADEAWLDSQTPTLEGLRAKYPGRSIGMARVVCGPTYCWRARVGPCESPHIVTEIAALRWLAAKLEELT